jgi:hypothetical protein
MEPPKGPEERGGVYKIEKSKIDAKLSPRKT